MEVGSNNVRATGVGAAGVYSCPYLASSGTFMLTDGGLLDLAAARSG